MPRRKDLSGAMTRKLRRRAPGAAEDDAPAYFTSTNGKKYRTQLNKLYPGTARGKLGANLRSATALREDQKTTRQKTLERANRVAEDDPKFDTMRHGDKVGKVRVKGRPGKYFVHGIDAEPARAAILRRIGRS